MPTGREDECRPRHVGFRDHQDSEGRISDGLLLASSCATSLGLAPFRVQRQTLAMTSNALRQELFKLSRAEKLELVEELWDNIATDPEAEPAPLSAAQREELDRRIREMDEHPERALPWEEVRDSLWKRIRR